MTDIEKKVVELRENGSTYYEIAKATGLSYSRCRQIYKKALFKKERASHTGFPEDMPQHYCRHLHCNGIDNMAQLLDFIKQGGDISKLYHIGVKGKEYLLKMTEECEN